MGLEEAFDVVRRFSPLLWLTAFLLVNLATLATQVSENQEARHLVYPPPGRNLVPTKVQLIFGLGIPMETEASTIIGYVMKANYWLPYNASYLTEPYVRYQRSAKLDEKTGSSTSTGDSEKDTKDAKGAVGRYEIYKMVESVMDSAFQSGKACLLRAICDLAAVPFDVRYGLFPRILHIFLTPSTTQELHIEWHDQEYAAAELLGKKEGEKACEKYFVECKLNLWEYLSKIH